MPLNVFSIIDYNDEQEKAIRNLIYDDEIVVKKKNLNFLLKY